MKYLLSVSNADDVRTIVTHDLQEFGISRDWKDEEVATNLRKSKSRETSLVSVASFYFTEPMLIRSNIYTVIF